MIGRLLRTALWLLLGALVVFGLYWLLLNTPESNALALISSADPGCADHRDLGAVREYRARPGDRRAARAERGRGGERYPLGRSRGGARRAALVGHRARGSLGRRSRGRDQRLVHRTLWMVGHQLALPGRGVGQPLPALEPHPADRARARRRVACWRRCGSGWPLAPRTRPPFARDRRARVHRPRRPAAATDYVATAVAADVARAGGRRRTTRCGGHPVDRRRCAAGAAGRTREIRDDRSTGR